MSKQRVNMYLFLTFAGSYAANYAVCQKVRVGSAIFDKESSFVSWGANKSIPEGCDRTSCNRILGDGLPHCVATIHSEVDAIISAKRDLTGHTIYVTRYPCENCARAIVTAGITRVVYGRERPISEDTKAIFDAYNVEVIHIQEYKEDDSFV